MLKRKTAVRILAILVLLFSSCSSSKKPIDGVPQTKTVDDVLREGTKRDSEETADSESGPIMITPGRTMESKKYPQDTIDVDLTTESANMVFAIVGDMMVTPENYEGKVIKVSGFFNFFEDNGIQYYSCIVPDATKCCVNGIEFELGDGKTYPEDYPLPEEDMTVVGVFDWYVENDYTFPVLREAELLG